MTAREAGYRLTPVCFTGCEPESLEELARALDLMEEAAEQIYTHARDQFPDFRLCCFPGEVLGSRNTRVVTIGVSSVLGEAYLIEDTRGRGWLVCRSLPNGQPSMRRIRCTDNSVNVTKACLAVLGGGTLPE